ncbi:MAG TPA: hypothetical protein VGM10_27470 [Actinocrinis sp.]
MTEDRGRRPDAETLQTAVERTWGSWPWVATCHRCRTRSPGQRTRREAWEWLDAHVHSNHEIV